MEPPFDTSLEDSLPPPKEAEYHYIIGNFEELSSFLVDIINWVMDQYPEGPTLSSNTLVQNLFNAWAIVAMEKVSRGEPGAAGELEPSNDPHVEA